MNEGGQETEVDSGEIKVHGAFGNVEMGREDEVRWKSTANTRGENTKAPEEDNFGCDCEIGER